MEGINSAIDTMRGKLKNALSNINDYPSLGRQLRIADDAMEVIHEENPSSSDNNTYKMRVNTCKRKVRGVCDSIERCKNPKDASARDRNQEILDNDVKDMIQSIRNLAESGILNEKIQEQLKELDSLLKPPAGMRDQFNYHGSGSQNNNTGSGRQYNTNSGHQNFDTNQSKDGPENN